MRAIDIDFDIHKAIERERRSFEESPNDALRRLIGIAAVPAAALAAKAVEGRAWSGKGATLPHGTELRMEYNGVQHHGKIEDGTWLCGDGVHSGPSPAAASVASTRAGTTPSLNGWNYWEAKLPGANRWVSISNLRKY